MHSRIFQVSMSPIKKDDYICEDIYYDHWFTYQIADYVDDNTDRNEDIKRLSECYNCLTFSADENGEFFIVDSKEKYFKSSFEQFTDALKKIQTYSLEDFATGIGEMWTLQHAYEDKHGFYIDADGELMTLDSFVRRCATGEKYYIGATIDYHC